MVIVAQGGIYLRNQSSSEFNVAPTYVRVRDDSTVLTLHGSFHDTLDPFRARGKYINEGGRMHADRIAWRIYFPTYNYVLRQRSSMALPFRYVGIGASCRLYIYIPLRRRAIFFEECSSRRVFYIRAQKYFYTENTRTFLHIYICINPYTRVCIYIHAHTHTYFR